MKKNKELWKCYKCGEFETKADFPKCPKCKSRTCYFIKKIGKQNLECSREALRILIDKKLELKK